MEQSWRLGQISNHLKEPQRANGGHLAGRFRDFKTQADMALAGQVIYLVRDDLHQSPPQSRRIIQVRVMQKEPLPHNLRVTIKVIDAGTAQTASSANDPMHVIALIEEQFSQVGSILAGNSC